MKKRLLLSALVAISIISIFGSTSCGGRRAARAQADSLARVVAAKDSIINDAFASINEIAVNVNQIAQREKLITDQTTAAGPELSKHAKDQIIDNMTAIGELLEQNRTTIAKLQITSNQLRQANIQVAALQELVGELQEQLVQKNAQIAALMQQVQSLQIEVASLAELLARLEVDKIVLQSELGQSNLELNTVHYIVGVEKELKQEGIIDKEGFIGRTRVLAPGADLSQFTQADSRTLDLVLIGGKRIRVITSHPAESYMLVQNDDRIVEELVITDKEAFWRNTKVLVISYH